MLDYLTTLAAVARYGTFSAAGDRVGLTQSAVSVQMRKLEAALGFAVFDRSRKKAVLNDAGRRVLAQGEQVSQLLTQMKQGVPDAALTGSLRVGAIMTALLGDLPDALTDFRKRVPQVELHITPGVSADLLVQVDEHRLDCALIVKPAYPIEGELEWRLLRKEPFVLIAAATERMSNVKSLLTKRPFIRYERQSHGGRLVEQFLRREKFNVRDLLEVDSIEMIALLVARGAGVSIVPRAPALAALKLSIREINFGDKTFYRNIGMVVRADGPRMHLSNELWKEFVRRAQ